MSTVITSIDRRSPADRYGIKVGEKLLTINGHEIIDVLDYRFYGYDAESVVTLSSPTARCAKCASARRKVRTWA